MDKSLLINKIKQLKEEKDAVILAHYYQNAEIQDIADFLGDSLALSQYAQKANNKVIVFCGVRFMAETAKILNPEKIVLLPDAHASCSLVDCTCRGDFKQWVDDTPHDALLSYINCSTEIKAMSDVIITSSNAEKIVSSYSLDAKIIFAPDKYLGAYLNRKLNRNMTLWNGSCRVHELFSEYELTKLKQEHPKALVLAHPECPEKILQLADFIGSTTGIINCAVNSDSKEFIIATEPGVIHQIMKKAPNKQYFPLLTSGNLNICKDMRLNTLEKIATCLESLEPQIIIEESLRLKALKPLLKMLEICGRENK